MPVCGNYLFFELPKKIVLNPKDGPWHLRYVGVEAATEIMEQGITLEEYLGR